MAACNTYPGMERWKGRVAIVTGASAGIGYELAKRLAQLGVVVVGCARNIETIETLSKELSSTGGKLVAIKCDVTKEEEVLSMMSEVKSQFGGADICVNNAGLGRNAPLLSGTTDDWRIMMEVNVIGLCMVTREFVKQMRERNVDDGHVIFMNSMSGHRNAGNTAFNFYTASKYAVTALTEGLRKELRELKSNIKITAISPGVVETEFAPRARLMDNPKDKVKDVYSEFGFPLLQAEDIADIAIYAISTPPRVQIHDVLVRPTQQSH